MPIQFGPASLSRRDIPVQETVNKLDKAAFKRLMDSLDLGVSNLSGPDGTSLRYVAWPEQGLESSTASGVKSIFIGEGEAASYFAAMEGDMPLRIYPRGEEMNVAHGGRMNDGLLGGRALTG